MYIERQIIRQRVYSSLRIFLFREKITNERIIISYHNRVKC